MVIFLVSWTHPITESNGVSNAANLHLKYLHEMGHKVILICPNIFKNNLDVTISDVVYISANGNGSLFRNNYFDKKAANKIIELYKPNLVLCESWQNSMTENFINICYKNSVPCVVISHGISLHPFSFNILSILRSFQWLLYWVLFKRVLSKVSALTVLSFNFHSKRLYDAKLAREKGLKIFKLTNTAYNYNNYYLPFSKRNKRILIVGYFTEVKNQLLALHLASHPLLRKYDFIFIGEKKGAYFNKCFKFADSLKLKNVFFFNDKECTISNELSECLLLLSTSITEVLPLVILESIASGTPFLARNVGLIPEIKGGLVCENDLDFFKKFNSIVSNSLFWSEISREGLNYFNEFHKPDIVKQQLFSVVEYFDKSR
jgi:glycosyltransferase involved in cell wall biosynthesis